MLWSNAFRLLILPSLFALMKPVVAQAEHYDVFILIGQSNMDGRAKAQDLVGPLANFAKPQADVKIDYSCSDLRGPVHGSDGWKPLAPGWSAPGNRFSAGYKVPSDRFGPEVSFGRAMADAMPGHHVAIIKFAEGGTSLSEDWSPNVNGRLYDQSLAFIHQALEALTSRGDTYSIDAIVWHQGESDAGLPPGRYAQMLTAFIDRLRTDFKQPRLPIVIGEVFDNHRRDNVRQDERDVSRSLKNVYFASSEGLKTIDPGTHFNAASQIEMGRRMAAALLTKTPATQPILSTTRP